MSFLPVDRSKRRTSMKVNVDHLFAPPLQQLKARRGSGISMTMYLSTKPLENVRVVLSDLESCFQPELYCQPTFL